GRPGPAQPRLHDLSPEARAALAAMGNPRQLALAHRAALGAWLTPGGRHILLADVLEVATFDLATQRASPVVREVGGLVRVAVSPDGRTVVTAGGDRAVRCWDIAAGAGESWVQAFPGPITALEITPDGNRVAASGEEVGYLEWDLATGALVRKHAGLRASRLAFTEDGQWTIAARAEGVEAWSLADGRVIPLAADFLASAVGFTTARHGFAVSPEGVIKAWDVRTGQPVVADRQLAFVGQVTTLEASGDRLIAGTDAGRLVVIGPDDRQRPVPLPKGAGRIAALAPTRDGTYVVAGLETGPAQLIRLVADEKAPTPKADPSEPATPFRLVKEIVGPGDPVSVGVAADGKHILLAGADIAVVHETAGFKEVARVPAPPGRVIRGAALVGDRLILSDATADGSAGGVRAFDLAGKAVGQPWDLAGPGDVTNLRPVPGQNWVLGDFGPAAALFDVATGKPVEGFPSGGSVLTAVPDADGRRIACVQPVTKSPALRLWSVETRAPGPPLEGSDGIAHVTFPPGGKEVIGAWPYGRIKIWDVASGKLVRELAHDGVGIVTGLQALSGETALVEMNRSRAGLNLTSGRFLDLSPVPDGRTTVFPARSWLTSVTNGGRVSVVRFDAGELARSPGVPAPKAPEWDAKFVRDSVAGPAVGGFFAGDGTLVVGTAGGRVVRYKADGLTVDRELDTGETALTGIGRSPDRLYTHGPKFGVRMWDADTFEKLVDYPKTTGPARLFGVKPDGTAFYLVAAQMTETDVKTKATKSVPGPSAGANPRTLIAYAAEIDVMTCRWANGLVAAYRERGKEEKRFDRPGKGPVVPARALALSADGRFAVLGTNDGRVTVNQTVSGKVAHSEVAHKAGDQVFAVTAAAFVPGPGPARFLTTATDGRTILWALDTFVRLREFAGLPGDRKLAVAPDGRTVAVLGPTAVELLDLP
ncbi:MAG TPA: hypothetical protein VM597_20960, partial [Gemmataceae bacterium]|nr:hypothetical protein [Gemmataceae bacterium]